MGIESFGQNSDSQENVAQQEALAKERTLLKRFTGKAKSVASVMALVSALSMAPGLTTKAHGQQESQTGTEQSVENTINEADLTQSSAWSKEILDQVKADLSQIETDKDAEWLARDVTKVYGEWYFPSMGDVKEGSYGIKTREYTNDDRRFLIQNAKEARQILEDLNEKHSLRGYERMDWQFGDMISKLEDSLSYSAQKQREALKHIQERLSNSQ